MSAPRFTTNIQKGGALLDDVRRTVEAWDPGLDSAANLERLAEQNLLGKTTRARTEDVLRRIIGPRFISPGPHVIAALRHLLGEPHAFREACYYETARDEPLLAAFAEGPLWTWWTAGRVRVGVDDTVSWLRDLAKEGTAPDWSDAVRTKVARGLLAALRDFGVLTGGTHKDFSAPAMTPAGFAYVAWRQHEQGSSARALVTSQVWRRWLLDERQTLDLFNSAGHLGVLRFSQAGSAVRIDWLVQSLEEVTRAAA
jgi:hypothetical protein